MFGSKLGRNRAVRSIAKFGSLCASVLMLVSCAGLVSNSSAPLKITNVSASGVTPSGATITWKSSLNARSQVRYGTTTAYGQISTLSSTMITSHSVSLSGLNASTLYHFQAVSSDASGSATSNDFTFTTTGSAPTITISSPSAGTTVSSSATVKANASDSATITSVQFRVDGSNSGTAITSTPYSLSWDTTKVSNGSHTLSAVLSDKSGNSAASPGVTVNVNNSAGSNPTIAIVSPGAGATVANTVTVTANTTDSVTITSVQFRVDGANSGAAVTAAPYNLSWDTTKVSNGNHTVSAVLADQSGNSVTSAGVTVSVNNAASSTPTISGVTAVSVLSTSAVIDWTTNVAANSQVEYGTTTSYGLSTTLDSNSVTSHSESISGLAVSTLYHYRVHSSDSAGSAVSGDFTFTTQAALLTGSSIGALAGSMLPGTWAQLNTNNFQSGNIFDPPDGGSILEYEDKGVWDPINKTVLVLGMSHPNGATPTPCNEILFVKYTDSDSTWSNLPTPCPNFDTATTVSHNYEHIAINPNTGDVFHREYYSGNMMYFAQAAQAWTGMPAFNTSGQNAGNYQVAGALEYFPDRNSLIMVDGDWGVWEYTLSQLPNGTWTQIANTVSAPISGLPTLTGMGDYGELAHYSPLCKCLVISGANNTVWEMSATGTFTHKQDAPISLSTTSAPPASGAIMTVDPLSGLILVWNNDGTAYRYDPLLDTWTQTGITPPNFPNGNTGATEVILIPISTYGVIMEIYASSNGSAGSIYLYKD
jgi:hypothetical protein